MASRPRRTATTAQIIEDAVDHLPDVRFCDDERTIVHENVARCRATLDWVETAMDTGKVDLDDEPARPLKDE